MSHLAELRALLASLHDAGPSLELEVAQGLLDTSHALVVVLDAHGRVLFVNEHLEKVTGYARAELLGVDWFTTLGPASELALAPEQFAAAQGRGPRVGQLRPLELRDGSTRMIDWHDRVFHDASGAQVALLSIGHDVSELWRSRDELEARVAERSSRLLEANQMLEATFNATPLLIAHLDPQFRFVAVNAAYAAADGKPPSFFAGKGHFELYPNAENELIFQRVRDSGLPHTARAKPFEYPNNPERGLTHWDWTLSPVKNEAGQVTGLVLTLGDVSDRIRAHEALARNEERLAGELKEKETLLREVHHRVKNNLQVISSLLSLRAAQSSDEGVRAALTDSEGRVRTMALVHERLYQSARLSSLDLGQHLAEVASMVFQTVQPEGVTLSCEVEPFEVELEVALPLGLILNELVSNACKHAFREGEAGRVAVRLRRSGAGFELVVEDDGVGLPVGFELERSTSLGLRIVARLARQLRATLSVQQARGTSIKVSTAGPEERE